MRPRKWSIPSFLDHLKEALAFRPKILKMKSFAMKERRINFQ